MTWIFSFSFAKVIASLSTIAIEVSSFSSLVRLNITTSHFDNLEIEFANVFTEQKELIPDSESVFDPAVGVGTNFSHYLQNFDSSCFGIEKNQRTWAFAKLRYAYRNQVQRYQIQHIEHFLPSKTVLN